MRAIVLSATRHPVRKGIVNSGRIELSQGKEIWMIPALPSIISYTHSMIIPQQHVVGVFRVDPQGMVVTAEIKNPSAPGLSAVPGSEDTHA